MKNMIPEVNCTNTNPQMQRDFYESHWSKLDSYNRFKDFICDLVNESKSKTFYKFSDGEYAWIMDYRVGSTSPGKRDSNLAVRDLTPFKEGIPKNDFLMCQLLNEHVTWFKQVFNKEFDYPVDYVYALVASKWFTKTFNGQIGLIGAGPKLDLIKELCNRQEYKEYLQFDGFTDYIKMPQKFLCDILDEGERIMAEQLQKSTSKIFLVGIGHAQQALLHRMKKYKDAVYIVVGSGIDAYAGVQDNLRPYMGNWINYQISEYDYSTINIWKDQFIHKKIIS